MSIRKWINNHPKTIICVTILSLLALATTFMVVLPRMRERYKFGGKYRTRSKKFSRQNSSVVKAKLVFEKIPIRVKELSGYVRSPRGRGTAIKCGDLLDVMWAKDGVLFMKEKGVFEYVLTARDGNFSDLEWDGQYIWVSLPKKGIWILDTSGEIVAKIGSESGLPPSERGLLLHPIENGRMFAVGSFGPYGRGWCAIVEFKDGEASVNIFHEATRVKEGAKTEEIRSNPFIVFTPDWIREHQINDRRILYIARCEMRYRRKHSFKFPLEIDLDDLNVRVSSREMRSIGRDSPRLEYNGKAYFPGRRWNCIDLKTKRGENLVTQGRLPEPYGSLSGFWVSAHYGLVGWTDNRELYQIRITDEERVIVQEQPVKKPIKEKEYFHTFAFEDANGPITDPNLLQLIYLVVYRKGKSVRQYRYPDYMQGGSFPLGSYKAWQEVKDAKTGKIIKKDIFQPLQVTEKSPERLDFQFKHPGYDRTICCGQVVHAITGKPMAGAFVMAGLERNLAEITAEEWSVMRKLPINPSISDPVLEPIRHMYPRSIEQVVRTDPNGRFEMSFTRKDLLPYEFIAFEENYVSAFITRSNLNPSKDGRIEIGRMPLFPAAKIKIYPCIERYNNGKPCTQAGNVDVWLRVAREGGENSRMASIFLNKYGGYSSGVQFSTERLMMNDTAIYYVPAGFGFKMKFSLPYDDEWCIPNIPQTINLKQGETFDLGRFVFDPAMTIFIKLVDSAGNPVRDIPIAKLYDDPYHNIKARRTDVKGLVSFYVEPNSKVRFRIYGLDDKKWRIVKTVTCKVGGRDSAGKEFILQY